MVDVVLELYDLKMELGMTPNRRVYNLLIQSLCQEGKVNEVLRVLKECMNCGYFPGNQTFTLLSFALLRMGKLKQLRSLLEEAKSRKFRSIIPIHARYVSALCKNGAVNEAYLELLNAGVGAGVMMYGSAYCNLIRAFIELGMVEFPPVLLIQMQELGFKPGRRLYREVVGSLCDMEMFDMVLVLLNKQLEIKKLDIQTCYNYVIYGAAHSKKPEMAMEVYSRMVNAGIEANIETDILILRCYVKSRRFGDAFSFFRCLIAKRTPVNKLYNVFICGFCEAGKVEHAIEL
ncbi:hypothetical protein HPP92_028330 [Vanilla planifolia]|uniref:Pentatricopeptide repeat-containing protein n=1 Tax=Vanilla planifolia TaxID=51239 RepID=A0A835P7R2_VANPL|nr:hypothetical protein HPP92_028330 [Vanilla planifolia]